MTKNSQPSSPAVSAINSLLLLLDLLKITLRAMEILPLDFDGYDDSMQIDKARIRDEERKKSNWPGSARSSYDCADAFQHKKYIHPGFLVLTTFLEPATNTH
ncbi:MAG: hypothetical protein A2511_07195 [Deltaproteobacteria bacterium RIFOXYD12_FULL_50_9]|nr:MAG: hypothetical protein A2511_07195 [Deltaproteobacteria bacterium RIFOXYD12_FULL_50_9]